MRTKTAKTADVTGIDRTGATGRMMAAAGAACPSRAVGPATIATASRCRGGTTAVLATAATL